MHKFGNFSVRFGYPDRETTVVNGKKHTTTKQTSCTIIDNNDNTVVGHATVTRSHRDQDVRKVGRRIALSKAMDQGMMLKSDRKTIFEGYDAIGALRTK